MIPHDASPLNRQPYILISKEILPDTPAESDPARVTDRLPNTHRFLTFFLRLLFNYVLLLVSNHSGYPHVLTFLLFSLPEYPPFLLYFRNFPLQRRAGMACLMLEP
jgi:hypothetical protein